MHIKKIIPALLVLLINTELSRSVSAKNSIVTCPDSYGGREVVYLSASTKNYQIKICGVEKGSFFMFITKGIKTTTAKIYQDSLFVAKRGDYIYEVVAESRWNEGLQQSESHPVSFTVHKGRKLIVEEKIIRRSVDGYFMLP